MTQAACRPSDVGGCMHSRVLGQGSAGRELRAARPARVPRAAGVLRDVGAVLTCTLKVMMIVSSYKHSLLSILG